MPSGLHRYFYTCAHNHTNRHTFTQIKIRMNAKHDCTHLLFQHSEGVVKEDLWQFGPAQCGQRVIGGQLGTHSEILYQTKQNSVEVNKSKMSTTTQKKLIHQNFTSGTQAIAEPVYLIKPLKHMNFILICQIKKKN